SDIYIDMQDSSEVTQMMRIIFRKLHDNKEMPIGAQIRGKPITHKATLSQTVNGIFKKIDDGSFKAMEQARQVKYQKDLITRESAAKALSVFMKEGGADREVERSFAEVTEYINQYLQVDPKAVNEVFARTVFPQMLRWVGFQDVHLIWEEGS